MMFIRFELFALDALCSWDQRFLVVLRCELSLSK